jgi:DNA-directed RNA polymerase subunit F
MNSLYEEYAVLDSKIKTLTEAKDVLKAKILEDMAERKEEKAETSVGKFTISMLKTWTYTPKVAKLEEEFKAQKAHEESTGDATFVEKPSLRFTQVKL